MGNVHSREFRQRRNPSAPIPTWRRPRSGLPSAAEMTEILAREAEARREPPPPWRPSPVDKGRRILEPDAAPPPAPPAAAPQPGRPAACARFKPSRRSVWHRPPAGTLTPNAHELLDLLLALLTRRPRGVSRARAVVECCHYAVPAGLEWAQVRRLLPGIEKWLHAAQRQWHALGAGSARRAVRKVIPAGAKALKRVRPLLAARAAAMERRKYAGKS
jgi:hypothetical protein